MPEHIDDCERATVDDKHPGCQSLKLNFWNYFGIRKI